MKRELVWLAGLTSDRVVEGFVLDHGQFAVTPHMNVPGCWAVTHLLTGLKAPWPPLGLAEAVRAANEVEDLIEDHDLFDAFECDDMNVLAKRVPVAFLQIVKCIGLDP